MRPLFVLLVIAFCSSSYAGKECRDGPPKVFAPFVQRLGPEVVTSQTTEQVVERTRQFAGFQRAPDVAVVPVMIVARERRVLVFLRRFRDREPVERTVTRQRVFRRGT